MWYVHDAFIMYQLCALKAVKPIGYDGHSSECTSGDFSNQSTDQIICLLCCGDYTIYCWWYSRHNKATLSKRVDIRQTASFKIQIVTRTVWRLGIVSCCDPIWWDKGRRTGKTNIIFIPDLVSYQLLETYACFSFDDTSWFEVKVKQQ